LTILNRLPTRLQIDWQEHNIARLESNYNYQQSIAENFKKVLTDATRELDKLRRDDHAL